MRKAHNRLTTEEFIRRCACVHKGYYDYSLVEHNGQFSKVSIICPVHGLFEQMAKKHMEGQGCTPCALKKRALEITSKAAAAFESEARKVHGDKYSYDNVIYLKSSSKVSVTCREHGDFLVAPTSHISMKSGCPSCSAEYFSKLYRKPQEQFIAEARQTHGDKYSYDKVTYEGNDIKVEIVCREHGSFWQRPYSHVSGCGCPVCFDGGFRNSRPGYLYVLSEHDLTKIGITNNNPSIRCKSVSKDSCKRFTILRSYYFENGEIPAALEAMLLKELRAKYRQCTYKFDGYTECFYSVNHASLLNTIEEFITHLKGQHSSYNNAAQAA